MAAILHDSVVAAVAVMRTRPQTKALAMITIRKSTHGFPFLSFWRPFAGLKITAGQRTLSGLIEALTGQTFDLPVMLTGQN